jgi:hypothetical protein
MIDNGFGKFTNRYSLSKTLRFELKPIGKTREMLEENEVLRKDKIVHEKYQQTKPFIDRMHRDFVAEALENKLGGLDEYWQALRDWQTDKKDKVLQNNLHKIQRKLREQIVTFFNIQATVWHQKYPGTKKNTTEILKEKDVFTTILKQRYGEDKDSFLVDKNGEFILNQQGDKISIFDGWKNFVGYFDKFFQTRENFYKSDGTTTAIATRIIDQNLKRFCDNITTIQNIKDKVKFLEVENNFDLKIQDVFSLNFYNNCLLQPGIDRYNEFIGGKTLDNGQKLRGINELINEYRQNNKNEKIPFLKKLDKQILSEKDQSVSDELQDDNDLYSILISFIEVADKKVDILRHLFTDFVENNQQYDLDKIYFSKEAFNTITRRWTSETDSFETEVYQTISQKNTKDFYESLRRDKDDSVIKKEKDSYKFPSFISLGHIKQALDRIEAGGMYASKVNEEKSEKYFWKDVYIAKIASLKDKTIWQQFLAIYLFEFNSLLERDITVQKKTSEGKIVQDKIQAGLNVFTKDLKDKLNNFKKEDTKIAIKNYADEVLHIYQMAKYFAVEKKRLWLDHYDLDPLFYNHAQYGYQLFYDGAYEEIVLVYNKLRNYLTKKQFNQEKWKLNFENATLADGWDKNKERDNTAIILRKNTRYYLGIMKKEFNNLFIDEKEKEFLASNDEKNVYEKMVYKFFPDPSKMFPKVCFSAKGLEEFQPSEEIYKIYKNEEYKKGDRFSVNSLHKLIDFYKNCLNKYEGWKSYEFKHLKPTEDYQDNIGEFYQDVATDGYSISFQKISQNYIDKQNQAGKLYLFEIYNKDWSDKATGTKNLHTLYFESVFSNENRDLNFPMKLNGQAEIFYRPKTKNLEKKQIVTQKNEITLTKGDKAWQKKRYLEDKIFFHMPMTLNRIPNHSTNFNAEINNFLSGNDDINIIGVDRGEKHLAYYSVINQKGEILDTKSLNMIVNKKTKEKVDYAGKLEARAKNREQARKDWQTVEEIKDLKKGYISQIVRTLADLAIEYNAIIVLEDLNMRFKQIRGGIEKSIYQQLEKALIDKFNFLIDKEEADPQKAGHLFNAYQLTAPFKSFKDMGKQTGIIFYTQASYTSKIDPLTGWRPNLYLKYVNAEKAKELIGKFSSIVFNENKNRFEFTYDLENFSSNIKEKPEKTEWTVCSCVERIRWNKKLNENKGGYDYYENLTDGGLLNKNASEENISNFKELFRKIGIDYRVDILSQIKQLESKNNEKFFRNFIFLFNLMCQIRNTDQDKEGDENDFILSPVEPFFDSRRAKQFGENLPQNGDENGAYNIARKGIIILNKITKYKQTNGDDQKMSWGDLYVSNQDWDNFASK